MLYRHMHHPTATACPGALLPLLLLLVLLLCWREWMAHLSLLSDRPSWPALLWPQAYTCDCAVTQMVWKRPHTTCRHDTATQYNQHHCCSLTISHFEALRSTALWFCFPPSMQEAVSHPCSNAPKPERAHDPTLSHTHVTKGSQFLTCVTMTSCRTLMGNGRLHTSGAASPCPSWPYSLDPQANTSLVVMHTVCSCPHATLLQHAAQAMNMGWVM